MDHSSTKNLKLASAFHKSVAFLLLRTTFEKKNYFTKPAAKFLALFYKPSALEGKMQKN